MRAWIAMCLAMSMPGCDRHDETRVPLDPVAPETMAAESPEPTPTPRLPSWEETTPLNAPEPGKAGRYEMRVAGNVLPLRFDTATGKTWVMRSGSWQVLPEPE